MDYRSTLAGAVTGLIQDAFGVQVGDLSEWIEQPPDPAMGDFALPCFKLSKELRMAPPAIAQKLAAAMQAPPEGFERAECLGGYLNFFVDKPLYAKNILTDAIEQGEALGSGQDGAGQTVVIDYSSINIAKRFHIGHLSATMIGHSLYRIYTHLGYKCIGVNHLGDWGTQFGKMIAAYLRWGNERDVEEEGVEALTALYVRFHDEAEKDPSLEDEGRLWFKKIEEGDSEALRIFSWFKDITLRYAQSVYDLLGVTFDSYAGESFYNDKMEPVVEELREKDILTESDGAYIVDLSDKDMPPCLILKRDGATLYATRDIAAALYRKAEYDFTKCLYVVAYQQDLHFRQLFEVIRRMGKPWAEGLYHVAFGMVSLEGQALATRRGHVAYLDTLLGQAIEKARAIIEEKSPELENKDEIAKQVGVGAVVFYDLLNSRIKDIDFWIDRVLQFEGETGPYVQYTHVRCCSVLAKAPDMRAEPDFSALCDAQAQALIRLIAQFPDTLREACLRNEPSIVTRHTCEIAKAYNRFYFEHRILSDDKNATAARLLLTEVTKNAIKTGLYLIGVQAPQKM